MERQVVHVPSMRVTDATYSQAIRARAFLFLVGEIGLEYTTG